MLWHLLIGCLKSLRIILKAPEELGFFMILGVILKRVFQRLGYICYEIEVVIERRLIMYMSKKNQSKSFQRNQFEEERAAGRLKFGTSVFHAYVHEWICQLSYNPRLNQGWGLSDGEGSERIWSALAVLVSMCRYATKQNRMVALNDRGLHHNEKALMKISKSLST